MLRIPSIIEELLRVTVHHGHEVVAVPQSCYDPSNIPQKIYLSNLYI